MKAQAEADKEKAKSNAEDVAEYKENLILIAVVVGVLLTIAGLMVSHPPISPTAFTASITNPNV